jgi:hypothetical protein
MSDQILSPNSPSSYMGGPEAVNPELAPSPTNPVENIPPEFASLVASETPLETSTVFESVELIAPTLNIRERAGSFLGHIKDTFSSSVSNALDFLSPIEKSSKTSLALRAGAAAVAVTLFGAISPAYSQTQPEVVSSSTIPDNTEVIQSVNYPGHSIPVDGIALRYLNPVCYETKRLPMARFAIELAPSSVTRTQVSPFVSKGYVSFEESLANGIVEFKEDVVVTATSKSGSYERFVSTSIDTELFTNDQNSSNRSIAMILATNDAELNLAVTVTYKGKDGQVKVFGKSELKSEFKADCSGANAPEAQLNNSDPKKKNASLVTATSKTLSNKPAPTTIVTNKAKTSAKKVNSRTKASMKSTTKQ